MTAPRLDKDFNLLRGVYYDTETEKFVSYALGDLQYTFDLTEPGTTKAWQNKIKEERSI